MEHGSGSDEVDGLRDFHNNGIYRFYDIYRYLHGYDSEKAGKNPAQQERDVLY